MRNKIWACILIALFVFSMTSYGDSADNAKVKVNWCNSINGDDTNLYVARPIRNRHSHYEQYSDYKTYNVETEEAYQSGSDTSMFKSIKLEGKLYSYLREFSDFLYLDDDQWVYRQDKTGKLLKVCYNYSAKCYFDKDGTIYYKAPTKNGQTAIMKLSPKEKIGQTLYIGQFDDFNYQDGQIIICDNSKLYAIKNNQRVFITTKCKYDFIKDYIVYSKNNKIYFMDFESGTEQVIANLNNRLVELYAVNDSVYYEEASDEYFNGNNLIYSYNVMEKNSRLLFGKYANYLDKLDNGKVVAEVNMTDGCLKRILPDGTTEAIMPGDFRYFAARGERLAYLDGRATLHIVDLKTKSDKTVTQNHYYDKLLGNFENVNAKIALTDQYIYVVYGSYSQSEKWLNIFDLDGKQLETINLGKDYLVNDKNGLFYFDTEKSSYFYRSFIDNSTTFVMKKVPNKDWEYEVNDLRISACKVKNKSSYMFTVRNRATNEKIFERETLYLPYCSTDKIVYLVTTDKQHEFYNCNLLKSANMGKSVDDEYLGIVKSDLDQFPNRRIFCNSEESIIYQYDTKTNIVEKIKNPQDLKGKLSAGSYSVHEILETPNEGPEYYWGDWNISKNSWVSISSNDLKCYGSDIEKVGSKLYFYDYFSGESGLYEVIGFYDIESKNETVVKW